MYQAKDLSILIPARNEMFLARTIEDILQNIEADTEVIAVLDGEWAEPPIPQNERVNVIYVPESVGQRAATNLAAKLSKAKYVMKVDAHCAFDKGFDRKMLEAFKKSGDNVTMVPIMRNLWAFDWKCFHCGWKKYQGPTPEKCEQCGKNDRIKRKMVWVGKHNPQSTSYCFDASPHFQYFEDWKHRPQYQKDKEETRLTETMSLQGSCFMATRKNYWDLELSDEKLGNWGNQGIEVAVKTWLSGGRVLVNHDTWYAHMFRTQGGDFSFPWPASGRDTVRTKNKVKELLWSGQWEKQVRPLSWLVEKFWPVPGWTEEDLVKLKQNSTELKEEEVRVKTEEIEPQEELPQSDENKEESMSNSNEELLEKGLIYYPKAAPESSSTAEEREEVKFSDIPKTVSIIGYGWVGKSVHQLFPDAYIYSPSEGKDREKASKSDVAFICVPTPSLDEGRLDTGIVEEAVSWCESPLIVIRSTVNPGTCDYLVKKYKKRIIMQPEYLGETAQHPLFDEKNAPFLIIGGEPSDRRTLINLYAKVYNANIKIRQVTALEAEIIKLSENRAISYKVAECQELYDVCEKAGVDYYTIRDAVYGDDPRFNLWWTFIFPDKRGFNSKCIPKDIYAWCAWAESLGYTPELTRTLLKKNKEWISMNRDL